MSDFNCTFPNLRVLAVDDYAVNQLVIEGLLKALECEVDVADSGKEAFEMYKASNYDIIFLDVQMPELDGYGVTEKIREYEKDNHRHIPIIALTANSSDQDRAKCLKSGMDDYIPKPIMPGVIEEMLKKHFPEKKVSFGS